MYLVQNCRYVKAGMVKMVSFSSMTPRPCYTEANMVAKCIKCFKHLCDVLVCVCEREREKFYVYTIYVII